MLLLTANNSEQVTDQELSACIKKEIIAITRIKYLTIEGLEVHGCGGIHLISTTAKISTSLFINNSAEFGGALYLSQSNVDIYSSIFQFNRAYRGGGGALEVSDSDVSITDSLFKSNSAVRNGGAIHANKSTAKSKLHISRCSFISNHAHYGGAIATGAPYTEHNLTSTSNIYTRNRVNRGGAVYSFNGTFLFKKDEFHNNQANRRAAALYVWTNSLVDIKNVLL